MQKLADWLNAAVEAGEGTNGDALRALLANVAKAIIALLDALGNHLGIGIDCLVFSPQLELLGAEDASLLLECLGDLCFIVADVANYISLSACSHSF